MGDVKIEGDADQRVRLAAFDCPVHENERTQTRGTALPHEGAFYFPALQKKRKNDQRKLKSSLPALLFSIQRFRMSKAEEPLPLGGCPFSGPSH